MNKFLIAAAFSLVLAPALANAAASFDPGAGNAAPTFVSAPAQVNSANAAAAKADAQRYASVADSAVIGTHGVAPQGVVEYDPGAADGQSAFVAKAVLSGAVAIPTVHQSSVAYADNSEIIGN
ncbi:MAG: hypothetical protein H6R00_4558 [Proteobacteria bacterium]|nr:hypothetical protein [Pseudomonadota bacterium]